MVANHWKVSGWVPSIVHCCNLSPPDDSTKKKNKTSRDAINHADYDYDDDDAADDDEQVILNR